MVLVVIALIVIGIVVSYGYVKAVNAIFDPIIKKVDKKRDRLLKNDNPYIVAHRKKFYNDALYEEYLQWLDEKGGDVPFNKWKTDEEMRSDSKIKQNLKF